MATLVLTTVGTLVGGPIGGAIGGLIGSQVDARLLAPKGRRGARLGDLTVQTSTYGSPIPKLFGTMRVAGTVIWATDLVESSHREGGGKGQPKTTSYSYAASFAVALSGRPIRGVGRIWADGKLLRGAGGDWKSRTGFRFHPGGENQTTDPLIASAETAAPAYRGLAYAVFEDFQLADYGNRIPSLTFEVEADATPPSLAEIATALSEGAVGGETAARLAGYAATGDSVRGALEGLAAAVPLRLVDGAGGLALSDGEGAPTRLPEGDAPAGRVRIERRAAGTLPDEVAIAYHEPARDWQAGLQRARRAGPGRRVEQVELAAALDAADAKALAEARLARDWAARTTAAVTLPWSRIDLPPGTAVVLPGRGERWRVQATTLERDGVTVELVATAPPSGLVPEASAGRAAGDPDRPTGETRLHLLDLPLDGGEGGGPSLRIAAAGTAPGWRRAALEVSLDGLRWQPIGGTARPATMGVAAMALAPGSATLTDAVNAVEIVLLTDDMTLVGHDGLVADAAANLAVLGDELIQFGRADRIGPGRWRLSGLLRGRRGTEWAMVGHIAGERFVLVEANTLATWTPPVSAIGATVRLAGQGVGDAAPVEANALLVGRAWQPPSPVRLLARRLADGTVRCEWTRRSRLGWSWTDGDDAPLGETAERYRVTLTAGGGGRTIETAAPFALYAPADQAADGITAGAALTLAVRQVGAAGILSEPATAILPAG